MKTDDLIDRLGRDVTVATPLPAPAMRTAVWLAYGGIYLAVAVAMIPAVMSRAMAAVTPLSLLQQGMALLTGIVAARAAFISVVPGSNGRARVLPVITGALWVASLLSASVLDVRASGTLGITAETDWSCVVSMTIGGLVLGVPLLVMLRRGAPMTPWTTAFLGGLAAVSLANIEACLARPHLFAMTILLWHGGTAAIVAMVFAWAGRRWLRWPSIQLH